MSEHRWPDFLKAFNAELLASDDICNDLPPEIRQSGWLGAQGATSEELEALQARLGVRLPPSYLAFLAASNGWAATGWGSIRLWSVDELSWLRDFEPDLIEIRMETSGTPVPDELYFRYGEGQDPCHARAEYFPDMLAISGRDWANQDQLWLNPRVRFEDGE